MYKKYIILSLLTLLISMAEGNSQADSLSIATLEQQILQKTKMNWLNTNNASGLGINPILNFGDAYFEGFHSSGDYHLASKGNRINGFKFYADRYMKISDKFYGTGSFIFTKDRESNRAWNDFMIENSGNPYLSGSPRKAGYNRQVYEIHVNLSTYSLGKFTYGFGLNYMAGDFSRLLDPRSKTLFVDYSFLPSGTFKLADKHIIGINLSYRYKKEKLLSIIFVNEDKEINYYQYKGLDNYIEIPNTAGELSRRLIANSFGGELQYDYSFHNSSLLTTIGIEKWKEDVIESSSTRKYQPGDYNAYKYSFSTTYSLSNKRSLHSLKINVDFKDGQASEYIQEFERIKNEHDKNDERWVTLYKFVTFKNNYLNTSLDYTYYHGNIPNDDMSWYSGIFLEFNRFEEKYLLPSSKREISEYKIGWSVACRLLNKNLNKLWVELKAVGKLPVKTDMELAHENVYTENVLYPDLNYYKRKTLDLKLEIKYSLPINLKKTDINTYIKAYAGNTFVDSHGYRNVAGITLGILTK